MITTIIPPIRHAAARSTTSAARWAMPLALHRLVAQSSKRTTATRQNSIAAALPISSTASSANPNIAIGLGGALLLAGLHSATGSADDFYDYRYKTTKDPDDIASFYGGEELMDLFCIVPIMSKVMMRNARFDDTGNVITTGLPGQMKVSMVFSDEANEETGVTDWFNKRERFKDTLFGHTCYDMVINYGFRTLEDGTIECYHAGEYFHGNLPIVSQIMLLIFKIQARWVAWATEHHINHYAFVSNDNEEEEEMEEESRKNMPLFLLKNYAWSDLMAMLFGYKEDVSIDKQPSFLIADRSDDDVEDKEVNKLPFHQKAIQQQISRDIESDRRAMEELLAHHGARDARDVKAVLKRRHTLAQRRNTLKKSGGLESVDGDDDGLELADEEDQLLQKDVYSMATDLAVNRALMRKITRQKTRRSFASPEKTDEE